MNTFFLRAGLLLILSVAFFRPAEALILIGADDNTSDPGNGLPWNNMVSVQTVSNVTYGSGVYLENQFVLTAMHFGVDANTKFVIGGQTFYVDTSFNLAGFSGGTRQIGTADLRLVRLTLNPADTVSGLVSINLNGDPLRDSINVPSYVMGFGMGKGAAESTSGFGWDWNGVTGVQRWGTNATIGAADDFTGVPPYTSDILATAFNFSAGNDEAAMASGDSGGGLFQQFESTWYLSGITAYTQRLDETLYDNNLSSPGHQPDQNYFIRISSYATDIETLIAIPEPRTNALLGLAFVVGGGVFWRRRALRA